jgi:hypothetical protein
VRGRPIKGSNIGRSGFFIIAVTKRVVLPVVAVNELITEG